MTETVGYTRLSQDGLSIPEQKATIREYCERNGLDLQRIYDDGERASGYETDERPEYRDLRERVQNSGVDAVVVRDTGRIGRDFDERMYFVLDCRQAGVELHSDEYGQHDLSDPWSVLQETAQAAGDDVQKRHEIERSIEVTEQRIENGCYHGTPPFGLRFAEDKCHLERDPDEWQTLEAIISSDVKVSKVSDSADVSVATVSRARQRGFGWYEERLAEYGQGN